MEYYVYQLIDSQTNKIFYMGKGCKKRMYHHVDEVRRNRIPNNGSNIHLYRKIKKILNSGHTVKYKKVFFTENEKEAYYKEKDIIQEIGIENLCNLTGGGEGNIASFSWNRGKKTGPRSEETKRKLRERTLEQFKNGMPEETKKKISDTMKNIQHSDEHNRNVSKAKQGHNVSKETRRKISESNKGRCTWISFDKHKKSILIKKEDLVLYDGWCKGRKYRTKKC